MRFQSDPIFDVNGVDCIQLLVRRRETPGVAIRQSQVLRFQQDVCGQYIGQLGGQLYIVKAQLLRRLGEPQTLLEFGLVVSVLKKDSCALLGIFERLDPIGDFSVEAHDDLALGECSFDEKIDRAAHCAQCGRLGGIEAVRRWLSPDRRACRHQRLPVRLSGSLALGWCRRFSRRSASCPYQGAQR
ncbi:hypothetical protein SAMN03159511_0131 [Pseudomonas sp. NFACC19-2]|nr:hypothetical protein SAMN03159511_0131 [Pseudomonas sp. NFACC19-2]